MHALDLLQWVGGLGGPNDGFVRVHVIEDRSGPLLDTAKGMPSAFVRGCSVYLAQGSFGGQYIYYVDYRSMKHYRNRGRLLTTYSD